MALQPAGPGACAGIGRVVRAAAGFWRRAAQVRCGNASDSMRPGAVSTIELFRRDTALASDMARRIVLDTSVVVTALRSATGAANCLLRMVAEQHVVPLVTPALFLEYEAVLKRPEQRLATGLRA